MSAQASSVVILGDGLAVEAGELARVELVLVSIDDVDAAELVLVGAPAGVLLDAQAVRPRHSVMLAAESFARVVIAGVPSLAASLRRPG
jgi:hypothetical protein